MGASIWMPVNFLVFLWRVWWIGRLLHIRTWRLAKYSERVFRELKFEVWFCLKQLESLYDCNRVIMNYAADSVRQSVEMLHSMIASLKEKERQPPVDTLCVNQSIWDDKFSTETFKSKVVPYPSVFPASAQTIIFVHHMWCGRAPSRLIANTWEGRSPYIPSSANYEANQCLSWLECTRWKRRTARTSRSQPLIHLNWIVLTVSVQSFYIPLYVTRTSTEKRDFISGLL
jgi:hypothetical protein